MNPQQLVLQGDIYNTKFRKFNNLWVEGGFTLFVPVWRYDLLDLGEIDIPEYVIEASELLSRIQDYYHQPVSIEFLDDIQSRDPTSVEELETFREKLVCRGQLLGGLMFLEGIVPDGYGNYKLLLGS